jgi:hypothetical protein
LRLPQYIYNIVVTAQADTQTEDRQMDDKTLHDILIEDGFNLKNYEPDECSDAISVWTDKIMTTPALLMDVWLEALEELHTQSAEDPYDRKKNRFERLLTHIGRAYTAHQNLQGNTSNLTALYATSWAGSNLEVGEATVMQISEYVTEYVENSGPDWFIDVMGYAGDMEEDDGDWAYEQMKDRQLEERG